MPGVSTSPTAPAAPTARIAPGRRGAADPTSDAPLADPAPLRVLPPLGAQPLPVWPGRQVDIGAGRSLFVRSSYDGSSFDLSSSNLASSERQPAVLVHGLGGASTNWTDLMAALAPRLDSAAPDLPGFGRSRPPADGRYDLDVHGAAVVALLERLDRGPVHLFGNSLGGAVATRVAAARPDLVRSLVLVSPALPQLRPRRGSDPRLALLVLPGLGQAMLRRGRRLPAEARARAVLELCYHDPSLVPAERLAEAAAEVTRRGTLGYEASAFSGSLRGLVRAYLERGSHSLWRQAAAVTCPVLLVWGRHDRLVTVDIAPRARRVFRDSRLLVVEEAGHVAQLEQPRTVARAVLAHLDRSAR